MRALPLLALVFTCCGRGASPELRELDGVLAERAPTGGVVREVTIEAAPTRLPLLDGRMLEVWAYNGQVPGPTLRVRLGDTLRVTFVNHLPQPTTIHWHGVRLPNAMDGVPGVTQPAVKPGERFVYEFTPKDAGTFWFHPHVRASEQVERGLYGVLVVDDPRPLPWSRDEVWVLDDVLLGEDGQLFPAFNTRHDLAHDGRWGNVLTVNGRRAPEVRVRAGERIRLRLVDVANGRVFRLDLGALPARAIAVDGLTTARPIDDLSTLPLAPGNRLDLDVTVPKDARGRRYPLFDRFYPPGEKLAELVVEDLPPVETPAFAPPSGRVPTWAGAATRPVRAEYRIDAREGGPFGITWTLNGQAFFHDNENGHSGHGAHAEQELPLKQLSHVRFVNDSFRLHPMHVHGMFFKVLARDGRPVDEPFLRDTVLLTRKERVDVALVPLDPGRWMLHCHILEHAEAGMMTTVLVK